jgi:hypothetical protein
MELDIIKNEPNKDEITYPYIGESTNPNCKMIVLFLNQIESIRLQDTKGNKALKICKKIDQRFFKKSDITITISNTYNL